MLGSYDNPKLYDHVRIFTGDILSNSIMFVSVYILLIMLCFYYFFCHGYKFNFR